MRNGIKGVFALAILATLAIGIVACGGGGGGGGSTSEGGSAKLSGTVEIWDTEYESIYPRYDEAINLVDEEFEKRHPTVTIKRVAKPFEGFEALERASFVAHEGPDIMPGTGGAAGVLAFKQGLEVLNDRISPAMEEHLSLWEAATPGYAKEGERYGVPTGVNGWCFYYNKALFKKAGLPTDFQPESWAEVREAAEKLKAAGIEPFGEGSKEGFLNNYWFTEGFESEATPAQKEAFAKGELPFTDEAVSKAFGPLMEMSEAGLFASNRFATTEQEGDNNFAESKAAMLLSYWNFVGYWGDFNPKLGEKNVGVFLAPGDEPVGELVGGIFSIPKYAKNKDAAWAFLEFLAGRRGEEIMVNGGAFLPNRDDVDLPPNAPRQPKELLAAVRERGGAIAPFSMIPSTVAFNSMPNEMNQVLQGRTSLEDAQSAMQESAEKVDTE
jgi:ABC-type glycerol-3-phosphate transport system substrate-binding protein